jgi:hypothetical protein
MANPWLAHVKNTMKLNPGLDFKKVLGVAKKSYKAAASSMKMKKRRNVKTRKGSRRFRHRGGSGGAASNSLLGETGVAKGASELANGSA